MMNAEEKSTLNTLLVNELINLSEKYGVKQFSFDNGVITIGDWSGTPKDLFIIE